MKLCIVKGANGKIAVYLNDHRITGRETKPLGGGITLHEFKVDPKDVREAISRPLSEGTDAA